MHRVCATDRFFAGFGEAEKANLSLANEFGHRADDILDRNERIDAMLVEQIDVIRLQPAQRTFDYFTNVCRLAVDAGDDAVRVELEAELGGDDDAVARTRACGERSPQQFLVRVRAIRFCRVEKRASELDGPINRRDGFALVALGSAVRVRHSHQAEADGGDGEALSRVCSQYSEGV